MGDGVGFSGAQLTILAAAFGPLLGAIGILFRALLASKDEHLRSKDAEIQKCTEALEEALTSNKELSAAVKEATTELRELRQDLWRNKALGTGREGPT